MNEEKYIKERVQNQIDWYSKKSALNKKLHLWFRGLIIVFSATIPFLTGLIEDKSKSLTIIVGVLGVLIAVLTSLTALMKFQEKWSEYRTTSETLKHEKYLYETKSGPYDNERTDNFKIICCKNRKP